MAVFSALTHHNHFSQFSTIKHMVLHTFYFRANTQDWLHPRLGGGQP